jgi:hypothetical protein
VISERGSGLGRLVATSSVRTPSLRNRSRVRLAAFTAREVFVSHRTRFALFGLAAVVLFAVTPRTASAGTGTWWVAIYADKDAGTYAEVYDHFVRRRGHAQVLEYFTSDYRDCDSFIWRLYRDYDSLCGGEPHTYMVNHYGPLQAVRQQLPPDEEPGR